MHQFLDGNFLMNRSDILEDSLINEAEYNIKPVLNAKNAR